MILTSLILTFIFTKSEAFINAQIFLAQVIFCDSLARDIKVKAARIMLKIYEVYSFFRENCKIIQDNRKIIIRDKLN